MPYPYSDYLYELYFENVSYDPVEDYFILPREIFNLCSENGHLAQVVIVHEDEKEIIFREDF